MDATLINTQKQQVFDVLRKGGVDPLQFAWTTQTKQPPPRTVSVIHSASRPEFSFVFDFRVGNFYPWCSPWKDKPHVSFGQPNWPAILGFVREWGKVVQAELNTPDPWKALPGIATTSDIAIAANVLNTEFAHRETERIAAALDQIKGLLLNHIGNSNEQIVLIEGEIHRLLNASEKMGRKDWTNLAIGSIVTLGFQLALPPEVVKQAFEILKHALAGLVPLIPQVLAAGHQLA